MKLVNRIDMIQDCLVAIRSCQGHMARDRTVPCTQQAMKHLTLFASLLILPSVPKFSDGLQSPSKTADYSNSKMVFLD